LIEWEEVAQGDDGLRLYKVVAEMDQPMSPGRNGFNPIRSMLSQYSTVATQRLDVDFAESGAPVGASSMRVACHVVSYPDQLFVVDSTFPATGAELFPGGLEQIARHEGRALADRPLDVLYTHCHFDHAGGRDAVEMLGPRVRTLAHPYTQALFAQTQQREMFFLTKGQFFRDCGITDSVETLMLHMRDMFQKAMGGKVDPEEMRSPFASASDEPLRVDVPIDPQNDVVALHDGRIEVLRFEGHIPGHLCVRVARDHLITGDMWLPATTSTVTPPNTASLAGIAESHCGVKLYMDSSTRLLDLDVDRCKSYPSHEAIFENPKRMAMRDLEIFQERFQLVYGVLKEHTGTPMRVLDLAWGGAHNAPIWKLEASLYRLLMAHDEAAAYVHDLVALGDLEEVEPERYVHTGRTALLDHLNASLERGREQYGHLDFRSYRRPN
jgi:glyoxylase-like metal-dependent hydrolase (beta-lactamase superfamily II)